MYHVEKAWTYHEGTGTGKQSLLYEGHGKAVGKHKVGRGVGEPDLTLLFERHNAQK